MRTIEIDGKSADIYDSMLEYVSKYNYVQYPKQPAYEELPKRYRVFVLEYRPAKDGDFHIYNSEFDIEIDGKKYAKVDCSFAIPHPENHRTSHIPLDEIHKDLYTLSYIVREPLGCSFGSSKTVYATREDAEKDLSAFDVEIDKIVTECEIDYRKRKEENKKRDEEERKRWEEKTKGMCVAIVKEDLIIVGVGKKVEEALLDAKGRIYASSSPEDYEILTRYVFGENYLNALAEGFPDKYDHSEKVKVGETREPQHKIAGLSQKAYDAVKKFGYGIRVYSDGILLKLPEEFEGNT